MKTAFIYVPGAVRWRRFDGAGDVRSYRAAKGWSVMAHLIDRHPITDRQLDGSQWWICETFEGDE